MQSLGSLAFKPGHAGLIAHLAAQADGPVGLAALAQELRQGWPHQLTPGGMQAQLHLQAIAVAAPEQPGGCHRLMALAVHQQQAAAACIVEQVFAAQILHLAQQAGGGGELELQQQGAVGAVELLELELAWHLRAGLQLFSAV